MEQITKEEFHARIKDQGVSAREHIALKCPICGTVQSIASLRKVGVEAARCENVIGFSCEGRFTNAGAWVSDGDTSRKAAARRKIRGCNWTLGGLFKLHKLEVLTPEGPQPSFEVATPEEAKALERLLTTHINNCEVQP